MNLVSIFLPRKGTETRGPLVGPWDCNVSIFLPRKGTETSLPSDGTNKYWKGFNFFTPQGDGNPTPGTLFIPMLVVSIFLPRKGTETSATDPNWPDLVFQFFYPARGRKQFMALNFALPSLFQFFYPARGRKPVVKLGSWFLERFNFFTPQGDGNHCLHQKQLYWCMFQFFYPARGRKPAIAKAKGKLTVSIFLPRKGTETTNFDDGSKPTICFNFFTPQGDGNCSQS